MGWITALTALLKLAGVVAGFVANQQLLEAGKAETIRDACKGMVDDLAKARRASDAVEHPASTADDDFAKRVHDKYRRPDE